MPAASAAPTTEQTNRQLKRHISPLRPGRWSLFTFDRPSQETYDFVRSDVGTREAVNWLNGIETPARRIPISRPMQATLNDAERTRLRGQLADLPGTGAAKLLAALDA